MTSKIGFIGLGIMGKPMAKNLLSAGYSLVVYNRSKGAVRELEETGAKGANSAKEVARQTDVVITMLPDSADVSQVILGPAGVIEGTKEGNIIIDMSTIAYKVTRKIAAEAEARGVEMLDAPVSGGEQGAIDGMLSIMVGGKREVFEHCLDIFYAMGKNIVHVGDIGMGQVVKACNQVITGLTLEAVAEAIVLGTKAGVNPKLMVKAISGGAARCWALEVKAPAMLKRDFHPGFKVKLHHKDLRIALDVGNDFGVPLPVTSLVYQMYSALKVAGKGDYDHSSIITFIEDLAGIRVSGRDD
ncbi:MAG: 2-hydroxy-3-oxopropionate reductase [Syntrophomonadaceae bacterium]|nr:2-hydroxy-3-oxopropionate reductase [Bacillota bacterium]